MAPAVVETLIGRVPVSRHAHLPGFSKHPVLNKMYPGMIPNPLASSSSEGLLHTELTVHELKRLDWFEADAYSRDVVTACANQESVEAEAYMDKLSRGT